MYPVEVLSDREERSPEIMLFSRAANLIFTQNATAAPSGPHVSGRVIQASDMIPRLIQILESFAFEATAFPTWTKEVNEKFVLLLAI